MTQRFLEWIRSAGCRAHGKLGEARRGGLPTVRLAELCDRDLSIPTGALRFEGRTAFHLPKGTHVVTAQSPPLRRASPEVAVGSEARGKGRRSVWLSLEGLSGLPAGSRGMQPFVGMAPKQVFDLPLGNEEGTMRPRRPRSQGSRRCLVVQGFFGLALEQVFTGLQGQGARHQLVEDRTVTAGQQARAVLGRQFDAACGQNL